MKIEKKKVNFEDARGTIMDIFESQPKEHCTIIHSNKNSVRGNHYHKQTVQYDFMVQGRMLALHCQLGSDTVEEHVLEPGDLVEWQPNEVHEFIALDDVIFITFHNGPRGGDNYENDTFRVDVPLHERAGKKIEDGIFVDPTLYARIAAQRAAEGK